MSDDLDRSHPLYRKIGASAGAASGGNGALRRAFRMVLARAAEEFSGMQVVVAGLGKESRDMDQVIHDLDDVPVIFVLEGPGDALAMAVMDHQMIAGLLEHATTGRVVKSPAEARRPTRTDATICGEFLDRVLTGLAEELAQIADAPDVAGYAYGHTLKDARAVELAFDDVPFQKFEISVDIESGAKTGRLDLFLPDRSKGRDRGQGGPTRDWSAAWNEQVHLAPVELEAVLARKKLRLADIYQWEVGAVVALPETGLAQVTLVGQNGQIVARGKLGRQGSDKAVRVDAVTSEPDVDALEAPGFEPAAAQAGAPPPLGLPIAGASAQMHPPTPETPDAGGQINGPRPEPAMIPSAQTGGPGGDIDTMPLAMASAPMGASGELPERADGAQSAMAAPVAMPMSVSDPGAEQT